MFVFLFFFLFLFFPNHEKFFFPGLLLQPNHKDTLKRIFCFHWQQENNICLCKISPPEIKKTNKKKKSEREKERKIDTRDETQVTFAIFYHCEKDIENNK